MGQMGFFDLGNRYTGLDAKNEPLLKIDGVVPWEDLRARLEAVWRRADKVRKSRAGRKPWDAIVMFKTIILCALYNLSDDQVEHQIRDRLYREQLTPDDVRGQIIDLALEETQLSPRELAVRFTDTRGYFVSEASVYRLLKAHDLITSPAFVVIKAADEFRDKTTAPNQLWQTDFTYLKVIGWGWFYLSTILDDYSRYIIAWKLCTNMTADDVTATLKLALEASGCNRANVVHKPRLLSDNGSSYISGDLAEWLEDHGMESDCPSCWKPGHDGANELPAGWPLADGRGRSLGS